MANFSKILPFTLQYEGGYANVEGDRGGMTYRGIARKFNPYWFGWKIIDNILNARRIKHNEIINDSSLNALVVAQYREKYWSMIMGDSIRSDRKATLVFDFFVHSEANAVKTIQRLLNDKFNNQLSVDGVIGMRTIQAINNAGEMKFLKELHNRRKQYLLAVSKNGSNSKFLNGWMNRLNALNDFVLGKKKV